MSVVVVVVGKWWRGWGGRSGGGVVLVVSDGQLCWWRWMEMLSIIMDENGVVYS
jgi:hypothetical protein